MRAHGPVAVPATLVGPWTPSYLARVLPLTPEEVIPQADHALEGACRRDWQWIQLAQRLTWLYGQAEALRRLNGSSDVEAAATA
jgi:hypothetical protein